MTIIGLTADFEQKKYIFKEEYISAILEAGGLPVIFPYLDQITDTKKILDQVDGLLLTGGKDVDPFYYGEPPSPQLQEITPKRDRFEIPLIKEALRRDLPILGICRGMHILNIAAGGTLYQDILSELPDSIQHYQIAPRNATIHNVTITEGSNLNNSIGGTNTLRVNSFHHQAVKSLGEGFQTCATSNDNIIEAIEHPLHTFVIGVQWHPSTLLKNEAHAYKLFRSFVKATEQNSV